ncbi:2-amino-4-hydroxy-6-hydroxymethyldihydropteridine diphosphokinase [Jatrophihabitans sp. YIM 134969]
MTRAVLSIGSNLGDRLAHLHTAVDVFRPWLVAASGVVETPPWGPVEQPDFLNAVLVVDDERAAPADWLERAHAAEQRAGRTREVHWGPRTVDVDVVTVSDGDAEIRSDDPVLTLPHPRSAERAFVLVPWAAVESDATLGGRRVADLLAGVDRDGVRERPDLTLVVEP